MIRVNTTHIGDLPLILKGEEKGEFLELDPNSFPRPNGPVSYELTATMAGNDLLVTGTVRVRLAAECARCLKPLSINVDVPDVCHLYEGVAGQIVDISEEVREDLLLILPVAFHCKEDCKGLCPRCGADLNTESCRCRENADELPPGDSPWDILDNLQL